MPNLAETGYLAQGYELPNAWTWERVHQQREIWSILNWQVPVALANGVVAWGTPIINGRFLVH